MKAFMRNVKKLQENLKEVRKRNQRLQRQLDVYKDGLPTMPWKTGARNIENRLKIQGLEERIGELEEVSVWIESFLLEPYSQARGTRS